MVRRATDIATAFTAVDRLLAAFGLLPIDMALFQQARTLPGNGFEDNVQIACAITANWISSSPVTRLASRRHRSRPSNLRRLAPI
jgi:hypothetical protein